MSKITRKSLVAAALAAAVCAVGPRAATWAEDKMPADHMKMSGDQMKMTADHMDKMKMMAADPAQAQQMTMDLANLMVMDHMAMQMAMDPMFKQMAMQAMSDPSVKKVHDDAKKLAQDPAQMAKMQQEIMADPKAMQMVMHMAHNMAMMHGGMMHDGKMMDMPAEKK